MAPSTTAQADLFHTCAVCAGTTWTGSGRLAATATPDGRLVLRLEDGTKRGCWLELFPADQEWLASILSHIKEAHDG